MLVVPIYVYTKNNRLSVYNLLHSTHRANEIFYNIYL